MSKPARNRSRKRIALLGASGHGKVVSDLAEMLGYDVVFFDKSWPDYKKKSRWLVDGDLEHLLDRLSDFDGVVVAIGDNRVRGALQGTLESAGAQMATLLHPSAQISCYAEIAPGSVVFANAVVNVDTVIGRGTIINTSATVDHDCSLADFVHVSPGASIAGNVVVGVGSWVGIGAVLRQGVAVGDGVTIGAGAAVVSDVPSGSCVVGVPAMPIIRR
jgi:sugar O-acyltransferase (sialic acid O-acetyltransferase NeuD family)